MQFLRWNPFQFVIQIKLDLNCIYSLWIVFPTFCFNIDVNYFEALNNCDYYSILGELE